MGRRGLLSAILLAAVLFAAPRAFAAADPGVRFGMVDLVQGEVTVTKADGSSSTPKPGEYVYAGSTIVTGADGEIQLTTEDSGYFALRANTRMRVDDYRAEGGDDDVLAVSLIKGTFRTISGWIGKFNRDSYTITTPTATIGIRGTDHEPSYVSEEDAAALGEQAGTYDKVNDGGSYIKTAAGTTEVAPNQSGYASIRPGMRPRVLDHIPAFYRPSPNESHIVMRKQGLRMVMEQRHEAHHAVWAQNHPEAANRARNPGALSGRTPQGGKPGERGPQGAHGPQEGKGQGQKGAPGKGAPAKGAPGTATQHPGQGTAYEGQRPGAGTRPPQPQVGAPGPRPPQNYGQQPRPPQSAYQQRPPQNYQQQPAPQNYYQQPRPPQNYYQQPRPQPPAPRPPSTAPPRSSGTKSRDSSR